MGLIAEQNQRTKISHYCPFKYWYSHYLNGQMCPTAHPPPRLQKMALLDILFMDMPRNFEDIHIQNPHD
jgi:hypothetical protein